MYNIYVGAQISFICPPKPRRNYVYGNTELSEPPQTLILMPEIACLAFISATCTSSAVF